MPYPLVTKAAERLIVPARLSWSCSMRQQKTWGAPLAKIDLAAATRVENRRKPTCMSRVCSIYVRLDAAACLTHVNRKRQSERERGRKKPTGSATGFRNFSSHSR